MDISTAFDIGNILVILLASLVIIISGWINRTTRIQKNRALQISFVLVFMSSFLFSNILFNTAQMRVVVGLIFITFIIPFSITFLSVWTTVKKPSITRIQYVTFISWIISLVFIMILRALFGWGFPTSNFGYILFSFITSIANGLFGGLISHILLKRLEKYRPSRNQLQSE
jgi:hypothetical protein